MAGSAIIFDGGDGDDELTLSDGANGRILNGYGGMDTLTGGEGADILNGGEGDDILKGGSTANIDYVAPPGSGQAGIRAVDDDVLDGGAGEDTAVLDYSSYSGNNLGIIFISKESYQQNADGTWVSTTSTQRYEYERLRTDWGDTDEFDYFKNIEIINITGSNSPDTLQGLETDIGLKIIMDGRGGDDILNGGWGDDVITGGTGTDELHGAAGNDILNGGVGDDVFIVGGNGDDTLLGGPGNDYLEGDIGDDTLIGGAGMDTLRGGRRKIGDTPAASAGDDIFVLNLDGGSNDLDTVSDFTDGEDKIGIITSGTFADAPAGVHWREDATVTSGTLTAATANIYWTDDDTNTTIYSKGADGAEGGGDDIALMQINNVLETDLTLADDFVAVAPDIL